LNFNETVQFIYSFETNNKVKFFNLTNAVISEMLFVPLSPFIADIVLQDLEEDALNIIGLDLLFYYRYVDDIVLAAPIDKATHILNTFNSFHKRLQFTIEYEKDRTLSFLDLSLSVKKILIDWFHKKTFSGRYFLFFLFF